MRIFVADDDVDAAITLAALLKHCGHETAVATSGEDVVRQARSFRPDAMLVDLCMPKVDGLSVARQLRQQAEFGAMPLIAVSGHVDAEHRAQASEAGFTDFLPKPITLAALKDAIERIAARRTSPCRGR